MIKHVVMWKFKPGQEAAMHRFLEALAALKDEIQEIRSMEIGVNQNSGNNADAVLIMTFDSMEALEKYKTDPRHVRVSALCREIREERRAVDFAV